VEREEEREEKGREDESSVMREINLRICTRPPVIIRSCDKYLETFSHLLTNSTPTGPHTVQHSVSPGRSVANRFQ